MKQGVNLPKIPIRCNPCGRTPDIPLVLMGYYNPILSYGLERLARNAAQAGVDGFTHSRTLPGEEVQGFGTGRPATDGVAPPIFLAAPTSGPERIRRNRRFDQGLLPTMSPVTGITGARTGLPEDLKKALAQVRTLVKCPLAVGFGISTPAQVADLAPLVDGIVVGSAIVQRIAAGHGVALVKEVGRVRGPS